MRFIGFFNPVYKKANYLRLMTFVLCLELRLVCSFAIEKCTKFNTNLHRCNNDLFVIFKDDFNKWIAELDYQKY